MAGVNDNLIPPVKGEIRNPKGKPKGTKHLSTIIRDVLENLDWSKTTLKNKDELQKLYGKNGWKAIVYVATTKAMAGDPQAMKWLAENGFGKHVDVTTNGKDLPQPILRLDDVHRDDSDSEA